MPVSLAIVNARIWTGDPARPWADALAVDGGRIAAVGGSAAIRKLAGHVARVVNARGGLVLGGADRALHGAERGEAADEATPSADALGRGSPATFSILAGAAPPHGRDGPPATDGAVLLMSVVRGVVTHEREWPAGER